MGLAGSIYLLCAALGDCGFGQWIASRSQDTEKTKPKIGAKAAVSSQLPLKYALVSPSLKFNWWLPQNKAREGKIGSQAEISTNRTGEIDESGSACEISGFNGFAGLAGSTGVDRKRKPVKRFLPCPVRTQ
jgi:hypothetical protein